MGQLTRQELLGRTARIAGAAAVGGASVGAFAGEAAAHGVAPLRSTKTTVNVWQHQGSTVYDKAYAASVKQFQKLNPDITIKSLSIPYAQFESKALVAFTSGSAPDIVKLGGWNLANYASKGLIAPVDVTGLGHKSAAGLKNAYAPGSLSALTYNGKVYGLPIDYNSCFLFYRRDHFEAAGLDPSKPPTTWEQVAEYAGKLTQRNGDGSLKRAGFTLWYDLPIWDLLDFLALPAGLGGSITDAKSQGTLSTPAGIKALTWWGDMATKVKASSPTFTNPNFNYGQIADGTASMTISGNFAVSLIASLGKIEVGKEFGVAPMPQWADAKKKAASGYSWAWLVGAKSKNADAAWKFLRFLQTPKQVDVATANGLIVPVKNWDKRPAQSGQPGAKIVAKQIPYTVYGPMIPKWSQMAQQLSDNLTALALGQKTAEQAAGDFDGAMKRIAR